MAIKNRLPHQFIRKIERRKWMSNFLKRNPRLSFRTPQATSANRAKGFSKENVDQFNDILEAELPNINFDTTKIYNIDETGVTVVQHKMEKVLEAIWRNFDGGAGCPNNSSHVYECIRFLCATFIHLSHSLFEGRVKKWCSNGISMDCSFQQYCPSI